jgi:hypothetical protein
VSSWEFAIARSRRLIQESRDWSADALSREFLRISPYHRAVKVSALLLESPVPLRGAGLALLRNLPFVTRPHCHAYGILPLIGKPLGK